MNKVFKKLIALLLVLVLVGANLAILGEFTIASAFSDEELTSQTTRTDHRNVEFNSYFSNNSHMQTFDVGSEESKIYVNIKVSNAGYLENGTIEFQNANFKLKEGIANENIQSIDIKNNKIMLNQINNGSDIVLELPVEILRNETVASDYFNKEFTTKLTGNYVDGNGRDNEIEKEIVNRLSWNGAAEAEVRVEATKYVPYATEGNYGIMVQTKVNSKVKDNSLPIKNTNLEVIVPTINNTKPTTVSVIATKMEATNGKTDGLDFNNDNYTYNAETGIVNINTSNLTEGNISWKENAEDEYLITYLFEGEEIYNYANKNGIDSKVTINANITVYNNEEKTVNASEEAEIKYEEKEGTITDFSIEVPKDISKGYVYANYDREEKVETEYYTRYIATINSSKLTNSITLTQDYDNFMTEENEEFSTTTATTGGTNMTDGKIEFSEAAEDNVAYNKRVEISQAVFNKILGENGSITVKDAFGAELGVINKDSTLENGLYVLDIGENNRNGLTIETTAPITEGQLEITLVKALNGEDNYTKEQMQSFTKMRVYLEGKTNTTTYNAWKEILLKEPETKVELELSKTDLTTVVENENVEIRVVFNTSSLYNALFKNVSLKITLPSYIEEVDLKGTNLLLDNGLTVESSRVTTENGHKVINVVLEGTQTEYAIDAEYKGAILVLNTDLTLDTLTPSGEGTVRLEYVNENDVATNNEGTVEAKVNYVAPNGVVAANGISNYSANGEDVLLIADETRTVEIDTYSDERTATIDGTVINNYDNDISNVSILGRIPAQGNTGIDEEESLESTFTTPLSTGIGVSGVDGDDYTVYYSDNQSATNDLEDSNNGWNTTATTSSKSYLIEFDDEYKMASGDSIEFSYDVDIPKNLSLNNDAYNMYKVYYNNEADIGTMAESKTSPIIGLTTGEGPELEVELASTVDVIREGQTVKMRVTVRNTGAADAENVKVQVPIVEGARFLIWTDDGTAYELEAVDDEEQIIDLGTIPAGETVQTSYYLAFLSDVIDEGEETKTITTKVSASVDGVDGSIESNEYEIVVRESNIYINLRCDIPEVQTLRQGNTIECKVTVSPASDANLTNTIVTLPLPDGITYESGEVHEVGTDLELTDDEISYNSQTNELTINLGTVGAQKQITLYLEVGEITGSIELGATARADNTEIHYSNVWIYEAATLSLEVSELTSSPRYVKEGEYVTYNLTITNTSDSDISSLRITDELPEGLTFSEAVYTLDGSETRITTPMERNVEISINTLGAGESVEISIIASADLLPDTNDKQVQNKMTVEAISINAIETNTVTNIIEYNSELHEEIEDDPTPSNRYIVSGTAWIDADKDGMRDSSEEIVADMQVILLNRADNSIVTDPDTGETKITTTGSNGAYQFNNLPNGEYLVVFVYDSSNYTLTEYQKTGVSESYNSDAIDVNLTLNGERRIAGITDIITINGENARDIDIGLYTTDKFDLRLDKYINQITMMTPTVGTRVDEYGDSQVARIEVAQRNVGQSSAVIEYRIVVTNEGSVAGYVNKIVDYLPEGVSFTTELNPDWYLSDNGNIYNASLENERINPGETKEVTLVVSTQITEDNIFSTLTNDAEIYESYNEHGLQDIDSTVANKINTEDDMSRAEVVLSIVTGSQIIIYITLAIVVIAIIGFGIYGIKKHVLKKKV